MQVTAIVLAISYDLSAGQVYSSVAILGKIKRRHSEGKLISVAVQRDNCVSNKGGSVGSGKIEGPFLHFTEN